MSVADDIRRMPNPLFTTRDRWLLDVVFWVVLLPVIWLVIRAVGEWVGMSLTHDPVAILVSTAACAYVVGRLHERAWNARPNRHLSQWPNDQPEASSSTAISRKARS